MEVLRLRWPDEGGRRNELAAARRPRLLLVDPDAIVPEPGDCLEDWVRIPADEDDVRARITGLERRAAAHHIGPPVIEAESVLRFGERWVALPPLDSRLTAALIERYGRVVGRDALQRAGWPAPDEDAAVRARPNALDVRMLRLRRRVAPLGLAIRTVRSRGYLLEALETCGPTEAHL